MKNRVVVIFLLDFPLTIRKIFIYNGNATLRGGCVARLRLLVRAS